MNKLTVKISKIAFLIIVLFIVCPTIDIYGQENDNYAIIYLIRLKKSTNSAVSYNAWIDNKYIAELTGNNPVFTDKYTGKWLVFNCAGKPKRVLKLTQVRDKKYKAQIIFNVEVGKRYFVVFDPSLNETVNPLQLISNEKGYEYLYNAAREDVIVVDADILAQVKYEKENGFIDQSAPVNETVLEKDSLQKNPIDKLNINVANKKIENVNHEAIISGSNEHKFFWKRLVNNSSLGEVKKTLIEYKFDYYKTFDKIDQAQIISELNNIISSIQDNDNVIIYYSELEKLIYVAIEHKN